MTIKEKIASNNLFLTDGGLETTLIFHNGIDLPHFAAFQLMNNPQYTTVFSDYYKDYLELAVRYNTGFILESQTWRANRDWGYKLGYSEKDLVEINLAAIRELKSLKDIYSDRIETILISGCIGPRGDGYLVKDEMSVEETTDYHNLQVKAFKEAGADFTSAVTMNYINEGLGLVFAAKKNNIPVVISFTVETNGKLPSGESLATAIETIDTRTNNYPLYYMINCAHPTHFIAQLKEEGSWKDRILGIRANASCKSHAELDESVEIDVGDKEELADLYASLKMTLPNLIVFGGCCGTDATHIESICEKIIVSV